MPSATSSRSANPSTPEQGAFTIAISGPSCAGKTTLTALLDAVLALPTDDEGNRARSPLFIHADAFFKDVPDLPRWPADHSDPDVTASQDRQPAVPNNDHVDSLDFDRLKETVAYARTHAALPATYKEWPHIPLAVADAFASLRPSFIEETRQRVAEVRRQRDNEGAAPTATAKALVVVDGFLLYHGDAALAALFDLRLYLPASRAASRARRLRRYTETPAPPGAPTHFRSAWYFDAVCWPQFVGYHGRLFGEGKAGVGAADVERVADAGEVWSVEGVREESGVVVAPKEVVDGGLESMLRWAVEVILDAVVVV